MHGRTNKSIVVESRDQSWTAKNPRPVFGNGTKDKATRSYCCCCWREQLIKLATQRSDRRTRMAALTASWPVATTNPPMANQRGNKKNSMWGETRNKWQGIDKLQDKQKAMYNKQTTTETDLLAPGKKCTYAKSKRIQYKNTTAIHLRIHIDKKEWRETF